MPSRRFQSDPGTMKDAILDIVIELFFAVVCLLLSFAF
jgi:hypothetical protein